MIASRPRLAVITPVYFSPSHSDVIVSRWLEPLPTDKQFGWPSAGHDKPRTEIASLYIAQFPENDIGRETAAKYHVPLYSSIRDALTLSTDKLAVDGVLLIGEHGDYPANEWGQKMYPRREFFDEIVQVFRDSGRSVPVFSDKHLSYDDDSAIHMVNTAKEIGFPLMGGSSIPIRGASESQKLPKNPALQEAVGIFYSGMEPYGYHSIAFMESIVAGRQGGESGIESVTAYAGDSFWWAAKEGIWSADLFEQALEAIPDPMPGNWRDNLTVPMLSHVESIVAQLSHGKKSKESKWPSQLFVEELASVPNSTPDGCHDELTAPKLPQPFHKWPAAYCFTHRDGFRSTHINLNGHIKGIAMAMQEKDGTITATRSKAANNSKVLFYPHFAMFNARIEEFMLTGNTPYPVEHYLLTTLAISAGMRALAQPGKPLLTPQIDIKYSTER
ncbi:MAG: hypothetical protein ABI210_01140 [Abditibacteriaceae bacterium]